jgi:hypothetical protein
MGAFEPPQPYSTIAQSATRCPVLTTQQLTTRLNRVAQECVALSSERDGYLIFETKRRRINEHLDHIVRRFADRLAWRLHGVSRGRRTHPPALGIRGNFLDPALCVGESHGLG